MFKRFYILLLIPIIIILSSCDYATAGALQNDMWIGTPNNPYSGIVSDDFYTSYNGSYVKFEPVYQGCKLYSSVNISTSNTVNKIIPFNTEIYDTDNCHNSTNNTRATCNSAGVYSISSNIYWAYHATGVRMFFLMLNGSTILGDTRCLSINPYYTAQFLACTVRLNVGDYIEAVAMQECGTTLNLISYQGFTPNLVMQKVGY